MSDLYQFHEHPGFENPPVIVGLDGWIDAGLGAANAIATLLSTVETTTIASFPPCTSSTGSSKTCAGPPPSCGPPATRSATAS